MYPVTTIIGGGADMTVHAAAARGALLMITIAIMLGAAMQPAAASADSTWVTVAKYPKPVGTHCDSQTPTSCWTIADADTYVQQVWARAASNHWGWFRPVTGVFTVGFPSNLCVYAWDSRAQWTAYGSPSAANVCVQEPVEVVEYTFSRHMFADLSPQDAASIEAQRLVISEWRVAGRVAADHVPVVNVLLGPTLESYCQHFTADSEERPPGGGRVALDRTPQSVYEACGFVAREQDLQGPPAANPQPPAPPSIVASVVPRQAARCGTVRMRGAGAVTVRRTGSSCRAARQVLAPYVRGGSERAGWVCVRLAHQGVTVAKCVRAARSGSAARGRAGARVAVYGIWGGAAR
jgi:hypothetical protein